MAAAGRSPPGSPARRASPARGAPPPARRARRGASSSRRRASSWLSSMMRCTSASIARAVVLAERALGRRTRRGPARYGFSRGASWTMPELVAHAPARDHVARELGGLLDVVLARRWCACRTRAPRPRGRRACRRCARAGSLGVVVAVAVGPLIGDAERLAARHDRDAIDRVRAGHEQAEDRVAALVVRDALAIVAAQEQAGARGRARSSRAHRGSPSGDRVLLAARREQRGLVDQVPQVGAGQPRRGRGDLRQVTSGRERHAARVDLQDGLAPALVGQVHDDAPIEAARAAGAPGRGRRAGWSPPAR